MKFILIFIVKTALHLEYRVFIKNKNKFERF